VVGADGAPGLAGLAVGVDGTVLSVALPTLSKAWHASESDLQWFSSGYFLVLAASMLPAGLLTAGIRRASRAGKTLSHGLHVTHIKHSRAPLDRPGRDLWPHYGVAQC
jgi:MFS family permease